MIGKLADLITTNKGNNTRISYKYDEKQAKLNWMAVYASCVGTVQAEKDSKHVWNQLLKYAMNDDNELNNDVGIGLIGRTGSGKTITMHVLSDIIQNKDFLNALYGFNLTLLWPVMKQINILNCEGISKKFVSNITFIFQTIFSF